MTLVYAAAFGLAFGSFVCAAIDRIPRGQPLNGRSHCDGCQRTLRTWELVPVLSYVMLRGRCSSCDRLIGLRAPVLEGATAAAFVGAFALFSGTAAVSVCTAFVALAIGAGVVIERSGLRR